MNLGYTGRRLQTTPAWHQFDVAATRSGVHFIENESVGQTANLLETVCLGFHTPATGFDACRSMTQRLRPLLSVQVRGADAIAADGTKRAEVGSGNVSDAAFNVVRYANSEGAKSPEYSPQRRATFTTRTATGHSTIDAPMNAVSENIHATPPPFAAVAPILHLDAQVTANGRTNLSNGAADAGGR